MFNTHFPLTADAQTKAADLVAERIRRIAGTTPRVLTGDFNCGPDSEPWRLLERQGLHSAETAAGGGGHSHTFHRQGRADKCIDAIFVSSEWRVAAFDLLDRKGGGVWPSDHFGLLAELALP